MSGSLVLLALPVDPDSSRVELVAVAAASISVVGSALSFPRRHEIVRIANKHLQRVLFLSQIFTGLAVLAFVGAVVLGVLGGSQADVIYSALTGGGFGAVALLVGRQSKSAQNLAFRANTEALIYDSNAARYELIGSLIEGIEVQGARDQVRVDVAKQLVDSITSGAATQQVTLKRKALEPTLKLSGGKRVAPARNVPHPDQSGDDAAGSDTDDDSADDSPDA